MRGSSAACLDGKKGVRQDRVLQSQGSRFDAGEHSYAYTRACGIIGKSFIGKRISALASLRTISELDRLIFPERRSDLPGPELLADMETRIVKRAIKSIQAVIKSYQSPPQALVRLLRSFEYSDLKTCLHYIAEGKKARPPISSLGSFGTIKFKHYPDLRLMLKGTEYDFLLSKPADKWLKGNADLALVETGLDLRYYQLLIESLYELPAEERKVACMILAEEISLRNCVWAFRLRMYFKKSEEETRKHLMNLTMRLFSEDARTMNIRKEPGMMEKEINLASEAFDSLERPLDQHSAWQGWRWGKLLNPETQERLWELDPRFFQNAASHYLYRLAYGHFRADQFTVSAIYCFIKLKQFEEDLLTSISEGLSFGMTPAGVLDLLEVSL